MTALEDCCSGVASLSALSGDDATSGPEEGMSTSSLVRGVTKEGARKLEGSVFAAGVEEKRNVSDPGSLRAGTVVLMGESKMP